MKTYHKPLFAILLTLISSCSKVKNELSTKPNQLEGKWKITGYIDDTGIDYYSTTIPACEKDNIITYGTNNSVSIDEGAVKCDLGDPQVITGKYTLNSDGVNIKTYAGNEGDDYDDFQITLLNETTLKLKDPDNKNVITYTKNK